ncbi:MAG TPA: hypothetical protein VG308_06785 [Stellaceae bacterium]|jgi:hypothetical protein|nr:hypothetical protein [Stellaceae bacterium]
MRDRTLFGLGFLALLTLSACAEPEPPAAAAAPVEMTGWRLVSGKAPSKAEFAALTATCQEKAKGGALDTCLATLGLKRGQ